MKNLKVIFMGTPEFAVPVLEKLIENTNVILVVTQPDKLVGRKKVLTPSPIKELALSHNIEVFTPNKIKEDYAKIVEAKPDIIITCAYGQIIPKVILDLPKYKCLNVHASLLPKYRGGAPIQRSIMNGDKQTGITIMEMNEGMDDGDIYIEESLAIEQTDDIHSLSTKLSKLGANLLMNSLENIILSKLPKTKQDETKVTFAFVPKREEEKLDFHASAKEVFNKIRALTPYSYCLMDNQEMKIVKSTYEDVDYPGKIGQIIKVDKESFSIKCQQGTLKVLEITPFSKKTMLVKDYFNGIKKENLIGKCLNEEPK